ncbi:MAG TPA: tetratricopeptide repeat protein, partial [Bradyrhizobium sp.]|nr:tetratricopeptide repeat protein [Bradyrhizobium sp.]
MALMAATGFWSRGRACARTARLCRVGFLGGLAAGLFLIGMSSPAFSQTEPPVKGEATFSASGGYARLVIKLAEDVESQVSTAGNILVIRFSRPVDVPVLKLSDAAPDYVGSVRRDPDGTAVRLSLSRKVTVNTMTAGERIFVDLLPDTWSGQPPALPAEVIRELSERARVAERALRQQRAAAAAEKRPPIRVRASVQPTFVRFVFELPDGISVSSVLNEQRLSLLFNAALSFDLLADRGDVRRQRELGVREIEGERGVENQRQPLVVQHAGDTDAVRHFEY